MMITTTTMMTMMTTMTPISVDCHARYKRSWRWADQTLALFFNTTSGQVAESQCYLRKAEWVLSQQVDGFVWSTGGCEIGRLPGALCEIGEAAPPPPQPPHPTPTTPTPAKSHDDDVVPKRVHFPEAAAELRLQVSSDRRFFVCPDRHFTHAFLACDVKSACVVRSPPSSSSSSDDACSADDAPLTPLPPALECANGVERVPYTLVCDHRPDCSDDSDEDFCVFPACRAGSLDCGDKQVGLSYYSKGR